MRLALATDAWQPQVNGVVTTLTRTVAGLTARGDRVLDITPQRFRTWPCPTYPEIRLAVGAGRAVAALLDEFRPDAVHVATEGPIGMAARRWCITHGRAFTTSYHTRFPEYVRLRAPVPLAISYAWMRGFHHAARRTLVATPSMRQTLEAHGMRNVVVWTRGVDVTLFRPREPRSAAWPSRRALRPRAR